MKAIIPVAGAGTKLRPHTYTQPKALIPIAGKPILGFIIDQLLEVGFKEFIFITGYLGEKIEDYVEKDYAHIQANFVKQNTREGIGHAIRMAKDLVKENEEVFIVLGDTIFDLDLKEILNLPHSVLGVRKVDDPREFGVAEMDGDDFVTKVVEKPQIPKSNMALVGIYKIKESKMLFDAIDYNIKNNIRTKDEFQLTDAIMRLIEQGIQFHGYKINNWFDCGKKDGLLDTNALMLKKIEGSIQKIPKFENTIIIHPVSIGKDCKISNSIIGPNATIGENATINYSIIKDSIIGNFSNLQDVVLHHSVVGSDATIKGLSQSLNIGDDTEIDFS